MTMLRSILVALGVAACLFAFAALGEMPGGAVTRAIAGVTMGVAVSALVYGEATFAAVALGAVSPLALAGMDRASPAVAAVALCLLWLAPRFVLAQTRRRLFVLVAASLVAAGVAGWVFAAYWEAPLAAHAASCVFAGSCLSLVGVVVPVSTTTAYALRTAAAAIDSPIRDVLVRAAEAHESSRWQPRASAARRQWRVLVHLSDQRAALERAGGADAAEQRRGIDERIEASSRELGLVPGDPNPSSHLGTPTDATAASDGGAKPGATATEQDREACTDSGLSTEPTPPTPEAGSPDELDIRIEESAPVAEARTVPPTEA